MVQKRLMAMIKIKRKKKELLHLQKSKRLSGLGAEAMPHLAVYGFAAVEKRRSRNHRFLAAFLVTFVAGDKSYPSATGQGGSHAGSA